MSLVEIVMGILMFLIATITASLRARLQKLENDDGESAKAVVNLERVVYNDIDNLKVSVNKAIMDLAVKLSGDYVQRRELELFRQEVINHINEGRREMLEAILRVENKIK